MILKKSQRLCLYSFHKVVKKKCCAGHDTRPIHDGPSYMKTETKAETEGEILGNVNVLKPECIYHQRGLEF